MDQSLKTKMREMVCLQPVMFLVVVALHVGLLAWLTQRTLSVNPIQVTSPITVSLMMHEQRASSLLSVAQNAVVKKSAPALSADSSVAVLEQAKNSVDAHLPTPADTTQLPPTPQTEARFDAGYLRNPAPAYPLLSSRLREEGTVYLRVQVHAEGYAIHAEIKTSSGYARLDQAALAAVRKWRFVPAQRGEQAVESWVIVPVYFYLKR